MFLAGYQPGMVTTQKWRITWVCTLCGIESTKWTVRDQPYGGRSGNLVNARFGDTTTGTAKNALIPLVIIPKDGIYFSQNSSQQNTEIHLESAY